MINICEDDLHVTGGGGGIMFLENCPIRDILECKAASSTHVKKRELKESILFTLFT